LRVVAFGDIHIGNIMSDLISFSKAFAEAMGLKPDAVVFVGDVIDGAMKYSTQIFKQSSIRPIDVQRVLFRWLILDKIAESGLEPELVVIRGNHDTNFIEDFLKPALSDYKLPYTYSVKVVIDDVLYMHYLLRRGRGSYATAITPMMVTMALSYAAKEKVKKIVFSHIHRGVSHLIVGGVELVALPSFMRFEDAHDAMYVPCYAVVEDGSISFRCVEDRPDIKDVQLFNIDLINRALKHLISTEGQLYV